MEYSGREARALLQRAWSDLRMEFIELSGLQDGVISVELAGRLGVQDLRTVRVDQLLRRRTERLSLTHMEFGAGKWYIPATHGLILGAGPE